jgi:hypothetical protein
VNLFCIASMQFSTTPKFCGEQLSSVIERTPASIDTAKIAGIGLRSSKLLNCIVFRGSAVNLRKRSNTVSSKSTFFATQHEM